MNRRVLFVSGAFLALVLPGLVFLLRSPVLIVSDGPFMSLYGESRVRQRQRAAAIALFRRVKPVLVAESAGPDLVVFAVEAADPRPYGVIFPYRYADGGRRYGVRFPRVRTVILDHRSWPAVAGGEDAGPPGERRAAGEPVVLRIRRRDDFYRAGLMAGLMARSSSLSAEHSGAGGPDSGGEVLVFQERSLSPADKNALLTGLREQGAGQSRFLNSPAEYDGLEGASCVILTGPAGEFLDRNLKIPVLLFSWLDPALSSRETLVIFDDSSWALAEAALRLAKRGEGGEIPSRLVFPRGRIADKGLARELRRAGRAAHP
jgi:hypothetical protein